MPPASLITQDEASEASFPELLGEINSLLQSLSPVTDVRLK
jgi:hypothetical protein